MVSEVFIREEILASLLEAARRKHPLEMFALLGGSVQEETAFVEEVIYTPWIEGYDHATFFLDQVPLGEVVGTFHSHPGEPIPSPEDLRLFLEIGVAHIIAGYPYVLRTTVAYDREGRRIKLRVGQRASF